jgi:hypothetical protein
MCLISGVLSSAVDVAISVDRGASSMVGCS